MPWCGIGSSDADRLPDATPGYAVHVTYVRPPGRPDRLAEWAPRIVGDTAAIDAWWRSQDPTRAPRFDLYPFACASPFGQLDISNVTLSQAAGEIATAFTTIRFLLAQHGFMQPEKTYLVYYDGPVPAAGARLRGLRYRRHPVRWAPRDCSRLPPGLRGGGEHVPPDCRRARAHAHLRRGLRLRAAPVQPRARVRCRRTTC